jgi:hypothetical protein
MMNRSRAAAEEEGAAAGAAEHEQEEAVERGRRPPQAGRRRSRVGLAQRLGRQRRPAGRPRQLAGRRVAEQPRPLVLAAQERTSPAVRDRTTAPLGPAALGRTSQAPLGHQPAMSVSSSTFPRPRPVRSQRAASPRVLPEERFCKETARAARRAQEGLASAPGGQAWAMLDGPETAPGCRPAATWQIAALIALPIVKNGKQTGRSVATRFAIR